MIGKASTGTSLRLPRLASPSPAPSVGLLERIRSRHPADLFGLGAVHIVTAIAAIQLVAGGTLVGQDAATQFYPWYGFLGRQLRALEIPGWNPFQFAGVPFAADPQSGWTYLPAMIVFGLLPLPLAVPAFLWLHLALAGTGTYLFARALRMPVAGATVAAIAYQLTGPVYGRSVCCPAAMEVAVWTPWLLAGAELAIRAGSRRSRLGGWALGGFALSQVLASWLGQGSYYALLALASFIVYRTVIDPSGRPSMGSRLRAAATHGAATVAIGFGFGAAGILPRLEYVSRSNLAGGEYSGVNAWAARISGVTSGSVFDRLLVPTLYYPGAATLALAFVGLALARRRFAAPYFAFLGLTAIVLASPEPTPAHRLLFALLPRFEELHRHWPERVSLVAYIAPSMLAGSAVAILLAEVRRSWRRVAVVAAPLLFIIGLRSVGSSVPAGALLATAMVAVLLIASLLLPAGATRRAVPLLLVAVIVTDLLAASRTTAAQAPYGGFHRVDTGDYYRSTGAAEFLKERSETEPFRFFGYEPSIRATQDGQTVLYRNAFADRVTRSLLVNNRAMLVGLHDVQGYNPIQVQRYVELMTALNGHPQDYHDANIFPSGLNSPLLDLLNVRYIVVPAGRELGDEDERWLTEEFATVYADSEARVLENPEALPRAWVVHEAIQVAPGEALVPLASGSVDPRQTALVETAPPALAMPADPAREVVTILEHQPDRIRADVSLTAAGLVVFSEILDPGWRAYIDGAPAPVQVVDHVLQAIPLPAGVHEIELRYRTPGLLLGAAITAGTIALLIVAAVGSEMDLVALQRRVRGTGRRRTRPSRRAPAVKARV